MPILNCNKKLSYFKNPRNFKPEKEMPGHRPTHQKCTIRNNIKITIVYNQNQYAILPHVH